MTIKQIVLDVLEEYKIIKLAGNPPEGLIVNKEQVAKSIEAKIQAVSIDREELRNLIKVFVKDYQTEDWFIDKILSLLKPVETISREEVEDIFDNVLDCGWACSEVKNITMIDQDDIITKICNLAIPKPKLNENISKGGK